MRAQEFAERGIGLIYPFRERERCRSRGSRGGAQRACRVISHRQCQRHIVSSDILRVRTAKSRGDNQGRNRLNAVRSVPILDSFAPVRLDTSRLGFRTTLGPTSVCGTIDPGSHAQALLKHAGARERQASQSIGAVISHVGLRRGPTLRALRTRALATDRPSVSSDSPSPYSCPSASGNDRTCPEEWRVGR